MAKKPEVDLTKYFCEHPFIYSEFHRKWDNPLKPTETQFICCPDWNNINIRVSDNLQENWQSKEAKSIREGHLSGNFLGCNPTSCPALNTLVNTGKAVGSIRPIEDYNPEFYDRKGPMRVKICSDDACNLKCPTCREELRPNTPEKTSRTKRLLDSIERDYGATLEEIFTSGGGDPFYSTPMREWLQGIDKETFPTLKKVILHTNGILFTPKVWEKMVNIHPHVKLVEISIDAATKDTYEKKTRLGGRWDILMENLEFIKTIDTIEMLMLDFVVQKANYMEMEAFIKLAESKFSKSKFRYQVNFQRVWPWPSIQPERYKQMNVLDPEHPEHSKFLYHLGKIKQYDTNVLHNFHEYNTVDLI